MYLNILSDSDKYILIMEKFKNLQMNISSIFIKTLSSIQVIVCEYVYLKSIRPKRKNYFDAQLLLCLIGSPYLDSPSSPEL